MKWATLEALGLASNGSTLDIGVRVDDGEEGGVGFASTTLIIFNVNPSADADGPYVIDEGQKLTLDATGTTDPDANDILTFAWDLDEDGFFDDAFGSNPLITWAMIENLGLATDGSPLVIEVLVVDSDGGSDTDTTELMITNVAPTVDAGDDFVNLMGTEAFFDGSFFDPAGVLDTHTYLWDFGDGHTAKNR